MRNLSKAYQAQHKVLDGINFDLRTPGKWSGSLAAPAPSKSTLLHVLNGTHSASVGEILSYPEVGTPHDVSQLKGRALNTWHSHCGMIFRDFCLVPRLDARSPTTSPAGPPQPDFNLLKSLFKNLSHLGDGRRAIALREWMNMLPHALQRAERTLSGGQMQRVAICRALMQNPGITAGRRACRLAGSEKHSAHHGCNCARLASRVSSVMVNLHSVELVRAYCTRVISVISGQLIFDDHPSRLTQDVLQRLYGDEVSQLH
ncbi:ATP-binding cassette domain-containing protein [Klebsiella pneumoniae]|nr:ATP-binding cassette domain-containing protein [Klebsiella pneumoniae]